MKAIVVVYHRADFDGIFCREIARKALGDSAEYIGWDYGDPEPVVTPEQQLYILDLSVPGLMTHPKLIWIDHHKSAIEKWCNQGADITGRVVYDPSAGIQGVRIDGVAACRLAWQWFFHNAECSSSPSKYREREVSEPHAVRLAGEYDIWDKRDPDAEVFQFGLRSRELGEGVWREMLCADTNCGCEQTVVQMLQAGRVLQRYQREQDAGIVKRGFDVEFEGKNFLALNIARCNSLTFESAAQPHHDGLMGFYWDGTKWKVSLYHSPHHKEHDLSAIAVKFGGGGHRGACGFTTKELPFLKAA